DPGGYVCFALNEALPLHTPSDRLALPFARRPWIRPWTNEAVLLTTPANTKEPSGAIFARGSGASAIWVVNGFVPACGQSSASWNVPARIVRPPPDTRNAIGSPDALPFQRPS